MRIAYCSDLHLEFGPLEITNNVGADVLILGGDILVAADIDPKPKMAERYRHFLQSCNDQFPVVFYLAGNHEHYHGDFSKTEQIICDFIADMPNIYWQNKSWVTIPDATEPDSPVTFFGSTMWTNFRGGNKDSMQQAVWNMNDYRGVQNSKNAVSDIARGTTRFTPTDALAEFEATLDALHFVADNFSKVVVSTHHAPTTKSLRPDEDENSIIHEWYNSELEDFIIAHPSIKVWTHGHTHAQYEWMVGDTQVLCNPRGYIGYQEVADSFQLKTFEI